jgi:leucyl-tRNA synthetase
VTEDIDKFGFNTAISQMMILVNELSTKDTISQDTFEKLIVLLAPFAPHLAEELWEKITSPSISLLKGEGGSIFNQNVRPKYNEKYLIEDTITMAVQFNGKVR